MSHDYAAIVSTLIVALLTIGTVQLVSLLKRWSVMVRGLYQEGYEARHRITEALKTGQSPDAEDFEKLNIVRPGRWLFRVAITLGPYVAAAVWAVACVVLLDVQISVLRWAGADKPGMDPELARKAYRTVVVCGSLMAAEGLLRACVIGFGYIVRGHRDHRAAFTAAERHAFFRSVHGYRRDYRVSRRRQSNPEPPTPADAA
ncbi:hypothetical protein [Streptomyces anulatus]|uniref:hypothetical protein n=1 Tax=Streptomyces anulatus TaxID=1892 RepID=UPI003866099E|nr:hypothetical protein OG238_40730 [Streptomyces anulatus]WSW80771.1 hypothetical protein OG536_00215 [Streptomyces anulatus]